jgi:hypothetical protein
MKFGAKWNTTITIYVHRAFERPVADVIVAAQWTDGAIGSVSCKTNDRGLCTITKKGLPSNTTSITLTVTKLTKAGYSYSAATNHDPDGDSNGTVIVVAKP